MSFGLDAKNELRSIGVTSSDNDESEEQGSVLAVALFAYRFFFRRFRDVLQVTWVPFALAAVVLFTFLNGYLSKLLLFISAPNSHVASLGLGLLAAGIFLALFCYTIAITAIVGLAQNRTAPRKLFHFGAGRQEWRLYAAYLRFLFLFALIVASGLILGIRILPLLSLSRAISGISAAIVGFVAACWLIVRVGFLIAPVAAEKSGPILRRALQLSSHEGLRISGLVILLVLPGLVIETLGEYGLRAWAEAPPIGDLPIADYARFMEQMLPGFLAVVSLSLFVTVVLLAAGAVAFYDNRTLKAAPE